MTLIDQLPKWIQLSVRKQFVERTQNAKVFFEELAKRYNTIPEYVELRIDGPYVKTIGSRNEMEAVIEVNALLTSAFNEQDTMGLYKLAGIVIAAFVQDFCIYKLGPETSDDKSYFETLQLITDDNVEMSNFGQIDSTNKIYQASVEAHYKVRFKNGTI